MNDNSDFPPGSVVTPLYVGVGRVAPIYSDDFFHAGHLKDGDFAVVLSNVPDCPLQTPVKLVKVLFGSTVGYSPVYLLKVVS